MPNPYQSPAKLDDPGAGATGDADQEMTGLVRLSDIIVTSTGWITAGSILVGTPVFVALASTPGLLPPRHAQTVLWLAALVGGVTGAIIAGRRLSSPP